MRRVYLLPSLLAYLCSPKVVGLLCTGLTILIVSWFFYTARVFAVPNQHIQAWISRKDLPVELADPVVLEHNSYLYVIGGKDQDGNPVDRVQVAQINSSGDLGEWLHLSALPVPLYLHAAVKAQASDGNTYIYVIGGWDGSKWRSEIWRTQIQISGDINGWSKIGNYTEGIVSHDALATNNHLYILGGENEQNQILDKVAFATFTLTGTLQIDSKGKIWTETPQQLPKHLFHLSAVTDKRYIYVTGGHDGQQAQNTIYYMDISNNSDSWHISSKTLPKPHYYHKALIIDGDLYIIGGKKDNTTELTDIDSISLGSIPNSSDITQDWKSQYGLTEALYRFGAVAAKITNSNVLYIVGGLHSETPRDTIYSSIMPPVSVVLLHLKSQSNREITIGQCLEYTIEYQNGESDLSMVTLTNPIPNNTNLDSSSITNDQARANVQITTDSITWTFNTLPAHQQGSASYCVQRTTDSSLVLINPGAHIQWSYIKANGALDTKTEESNPVFNPSYPIYLPIINR